MEEKEKKSYITRFLILYCQKSNRPAGGGVWLVSWLLGGFQTILLSYPGQVLGHPREHRRVAVQGTPAHNQQVREIQPYKAHLHTTNRSERYNHPGHTCTRPAGQRDTTIQGTPVHNQQIREIQPSRTHLYTTSRSERLNHQGHTSTQPAVQRYTIIQGTPAHNQQVREIQPFREHLLYTQPTCQRDTTIQGTTTQPTGTTISEVEPFKEQVRNPGVIPVTLVKIILKVVRLLTVSSTQCSS